MGYITYDRSRIWRGEEIYIGKLSGPHKRFPKRDVRPMQERLQRLKKPLFKPTRLIRVADMQVIKGSDLTDDDYYCAISYSWNQSGDICKQEDSVSEDIICIDKGKHTIIDSAAKKIKTRGKPRGRKKIRVPAKTRQVTFLQLIQQMCFDLDIQYIWLDQLCIHQNDSGDKKREMQQMHRVYGNTLFTIVLIPEFKVTRIRVRNNTTNKNKYTYHSNLENAVFTEWSRRSWCLEEFAVSHCVLYTGYNFHIWSDSCAELTVTRPLYHHHAYFTVFAKDLKWAASTALYHAHKRRSTKAHDRIFALANIYPGAIRQINFDYNEPIYKLMNKFYSILCTIDIRVLLFGVDYVIDNIGMAKRKMFATFLPSWVGMPYTHTPQLAMYDLAPINPSPNYIIDETNAIRTRCRSVCAKILKNVNADIPRRRVRDRQSLTSPFQRPQKMKVWDESHSADNSIILRSNKYIDLVQQRSFSSTQQTHTTPLPQRSASAPELQTNSTQRNRSLLTFVVSPKLGYVNFDNLSYPGLYGLTPTHRLPLNMIAKERIRGSSKVSLLPSVNDSNHVGYLSLTDDTCANIIILTELAYTTCFQELLVMPVVRKEEDHFKSIGVCFLHKCVDYASMESLREFTIR
ncbi:hypothetical protein INT45_007288 [Circinella minor]|uniref:Heterokaryon incompatibility domain-containing protein n=1 Tax=Circinella minor TaxID=1195481 RepID=A0A8H7S7T0_9FUNG|nr:hypothetical protein INT45_007288 [Circinella minor]